MAATCGARVPWSRPRNRVRRCGHSAKKAPLSTGTGIDPIACLPHTKRREAERFLTDSEERRLLLFVLARVIRRSFPGLNARSTNGAHPVLEMSPWGLRKDANLASRCLSHGLPCILRICASGDRDLRRERLGWLRHRPLPRIRRKLRQSRGSRTLPRPTVCSGCHVRPHRPERNHWRQGDRRECRALRRFRVPGDGRDHLLALNSLRANENGRRRSAARNLLSSCAYRDQVLSNFRVAM
jgi:hypothetical protein